MISTCNIRRCFTFNRITCESSSTSFTNGNRYNINIDNGTLKMLRKLQLTFFPHKQRNLNRIGKMQTFRSNSTGSSDYRRHFQLSLMIKYTDKGTYNPFVPTLTSFLLTKCLQKASISGCASQLSFEETTKHDRSLDDLLRIANNSGQHDFLRALFSIQVSRLKPILEEGDPIQNGVYILVDVSICISNTWWVLLLVNQKVLEGTCSQVLWSTSVDSLMDYNTTPFVFSLFGIFGYHFSTF